MNSTVRLPVSAYQQSALPSTPANYKHCQLGVNTIHLDHLNDLPIAGQRYHG